MLNGQGQQFAGGVSVCVLSVAVGCVLRRGCLPSMLIGYLFLRVPPGSSQHFDEPLMKEPGLTINFHRVIIYCFGNNSLKSLHTHLGFPMVEGSHELSEEIDSTCLFISHVLRTNSVASTA